MAIQYFQCTTEMVSLKGQHGPWYQKLLRGPRESVGSHALVFSILRLIFSILRMGITCLQGQRKVGYSYHILPEMEKRVFWDNYSQRILANMTTHHAGLALLFVIQRVAFPTSDILLHPNLAGL